MFNGRQKCRLFYFKIFPKCFGNVVDRRIFVEIVTTMTDQLTDLETQAFEKIKHARMSNYYSLAVQSVLENPTVGRIKKLIYELIEQAKDNPARMAEALNFDLPNMFNLKLYTPERLNEELRFLGFAYRAVRIVPYTNDSAACCAQAGYFTVEGCAATTYKTGQWPVV
jgi:hypothetical protein